MGVGAHDKNEDEQQQEEEDEPEEPEKQKLNGEDETMEMKDLSRSKDVENPPILVIGETKPFCKTSFLRCGLFIFNSILAVLGLVIVILAIWLRTDSDFLKYETNLENSSFYIVCYLLIVAGVILIIVAFMGCLGLVIESQALLTAYFIIFAIIFLLEVAAVVLVFAAPYSSTLRGSLEKQVKRQVDKYNSESSSRYFVDFVQDHLKCCGSTGSSDFPKDSIVPKSCHHPDTGILFSDGCASVLVKYLRSKAGIIGGVTIPILLFQLLAKIFSFCLIYNIKNESRYTMRD